MLNNRQKDQSYSKEIEEDAHLLSPVHLRVVDFSKSISQDSDDEDFQIHPRFDTPMSDKIAAIKKGVSKSQRARKQKIEQIRSLNDFWKWYFQHPMGHFPILYFMICCLSSLIFCITWLMDQKISCHCNC